MMHRHCRRAAFAAAVSLALAVAACSGDAERAVEQTPDVRAAIASVPGTFTWRADLDRYEYSDRVRLEGSLAAQSREMMVPRLVDCLDDASPSQSRIDGTAVAVGIVCYEALTQLVYYEPTAPSGDVAADWPGNISPTSSPQEMHDAKNAWAKVVDAKAFIFQ
jgi:hypothetical protein